MPQKWKTIRLFISSTFCDMHAEGIILVIRRQYDLTRNVSHYLIDLVDESIIVLNIESNCL